MVEERYSRHIWIWGKNEKEKQNEVGEKIQDKIREENIAIIGTNNLASLVASDFSAIGVGRITIIGDDDKKKNIFFRDKVNAREIVYFLSQVNPNSRIEYIQGNLSNLTYARAWLPSDTNTIVDATNIPQSKYNSCSYALERGIDAFLGYASSRDIIFSPYERNGKENGLAEAVEFHINDYAEKDENTTNAQILSAIIIDEWRKKFVNDRKLGRFFYSNSHDGSYDCYEKAFLKKKILQIGIGAIGTYSGLELVDKAKEVILIDFDRVDPANLHAQILFFDSLGEYKAEVAAKKLNTLSKITKFSGIVDKITSNSSHYFAKEKPDLILSCVDNSLAREILNNFAAEYKIPIINGGSWEFMCGVTSYVPGKTACLDCLSFGTIRRIASEQRETEKRGERLKFGNNPECFEPSVLIPNQIAGALMIDEARKIFSGNPSKCKIAYRTGQGIVNGVELKNCSDKCKWRS